MPGASVKAALSLLEEHGLTAQLQAVDLKVRPVTSDQILDPARFHLRVTQADPAGDGALLRTEVSLIGSGQAVEEGTMVWWVPELDRGDLLDNRRVASPEWGTLVAAELSEMAAFSVAAAYYDGTIGLVAPGRQVQLRIYRGRVIDVARRAVKGADFTLSASGGTWMDLITAPTNEFMDRAMEGEFTTDGDGYEYLRTTKLLVLIVEAARAVARKGD
jgi:putative sterol carrier protein